MGQPYVGEIRIFAGTFEPAGWMFCSGQLLAISENDTLFALIGTTYGGDGQSTFGLPDLRGRLPLHMVSGPGTTYNIGVNGVVPASPVILLNNFANQGAAADALLAQTQVLVPYAAPSVGVAVSPSSVSPLGGDQPHNNLQPYLCINFIISLFGIFPSQT